MTRLNENAPTRCCNTGEGNDNPQEKEEVMTTVASDVKTAWHPHWCNPEECYLDSSGGIDHDYFHYSTSREVPYGRQHDIQVQSLVLENLDGNPPIPEVPVEGRVYIKDGGHDLDLSVEEAKQLASELILAAQDAERSTLAANVSDASEGVVAEQLEDAYVIESEAVRMIARDVTDRYGRIETVFDLIEKVPPQEWWAIVRKHVELEGRNV